MLIIGAKGFAKQLFDIVLQNYPNTEICLFDDVTIDSTNFFYDQFRILKSRTEVVEHFKRDKRFILGIGNPHIREKLSNSFLNLGGTLTSIISSKCSIGNFNVSIGAGTTILHAVVIDSNVCIGKGGLVNHGSIITHDVKLGDYCEVCPGTKIAGNCSIGNNTFLGINTTILPNVHIGNNVIIGAGSVVTKDLPDNCTAFGVPAKVIKK